MSKSKEQELKEQFKEHLKKSGFSDPDKTYNEMEQKGEHLTYVDRNGWPLSHVVCFYGIKDIVPQIIAKKLVNFLDKNGGTPLHWACLTHRHEVIKELVNNGADVDIQNNDKMKPLLKLLAVNNEEKDFVSMELILNKSKDPIALAKEARSGCGIDNAKPTEPTAERDFLNKYIASNVIGVPGSFNHKVSNELKENELKR